MWFIYGNISLSVFCVETRMQRNVDFVGKIYEEWPF